MSSASERGQINAQHNVNSTGNDSLGALIKSRYSSDTVLNNAKIEK